MASVHRRKDKDGKEVGPWYAYWRDESGKQRSKKVVTKSKKEARKIAVAREQECERRRELGVKGELTVDEAYERYERQVKSKKIRGKPVSARHVQLTRAKYARLTGTVWCMKEKQYVEIDPFIRRDQYVSQIRRSQLTDFFNHTIDEGLGSDLRYKTQLIVKALIEIAEDNDFATPKRKIRFDKIEHDEYKPPSVEAHEWDALLKNLRGSPNPSNAILLMWLLNTGARISEALNARVSDVDLLAGKVKLRRAKGNPDVWWRISEAFSDELAAYLKMGADRQTFLFESPRRPGERRSHCCEWFRTATIDTKINPPKGVIGNRGRVRLHTVRHFFITRMIEGGMPLSSVSKLIGHKSPMITSRYDGSKGEAFQSKALEILTR